MTESGRSRLVRRMVAAHVLIVCIFGQAYAKIPLDLGGVSLFPTEILIVLTCIAAMPLLRDVPRDVYTIRTAAFVALGVAWILTAGVGPASGAGVKAFSFFVYSALYFVVRASVVTDELRWRLLYCCCVAAPCAVAIGAWQMRTGAPVFTSAFEETTTGSIRWLPGEFALYALLAITIVVVKMIINRQFTARGAILMGFAGAELILAQHRSGFVALAIALLVTAAFLGGSTQAIKGLLKVVVLLAVGLVLFAYTVGGSYLDETLNRVSSVGDTGDANISWRLLSWYEVFDGIRDAPWGHGFAHWEFLFNSFDPLTGSHNSFLDLTYRVGVPGLLLFLSIPIRFITDTRSRVQRVGPAGNILPITICACLIAFMIYASFNVVLETPYMSVFFWILLGLGTGTLNDRAPDNSPAPAKT